MAIVFLALIWRLVAETESLNHSTEVIASAEQIRQLAVDMETGQRGFLLTGEAGFLEPYNRATQRLPDAISRLNALVKDNPEQTQRSRVIAADIEDWKSHAGQMTPGGVSVPELVAGKSRMDQTRADIDSFLVAERSLSAARSKKVRNATWAAVLITVVLAVIAAVALAVSIRREIQRLSERYERALEAATNAAAAKDMLLATVSHELRSPLTSILGWSTLLQQPDADPAMVPLALTSIEQSARLQAHLIEDLIDVSRAATGTLRVDLARIDLRNVIEAAVETIKPAADAKQVALSASLPDGELPVKGDAARLQQVFGNLLNNAVRFTPAGGTIQVATSSENGSEIVRVRDSGAGIDRAFLPHVFETFAQEHAATHRSTGLGLGLSIARRLVELHGGTIEARSDGPGRGAEFVVRLPHFAGRTSVTQ